MKLTPRTRMILQATAVFGAGVAVGYFLIPPRRRTTPASGFTPGLSDPSMAGSSGAATQAVVASSGGTFGPASQGSGTAYFPAGYTPAKPVYTVLGQTPYEVAAPQPSALRNVGGQTPFVVAGSDAGGKYRSSGVIEGRLSGTQSRSAGVATKSGQAPTQDPAFR